MRIAVVSGPGPWSSAATTATAVGQAWATQGHAVRCLTAPPLVPVIPPHFVPVPGRTALRLTTASTGAEGVTDPLDAELAGLDLVLGLLDALEFRDGGGPWLTRLARAAAAQSAPLVILAPTVAISTRELRVLQVEAAYGVDDLAPITLERIARTWSW
jgi:hypothetical protein